MFICQQCSHEWEARNGLSKLDPDIRDMVNNRSYDRSFIRLSFGLTVEQLPDVDPKPGRCPKCQSRLWGRNRVNEAQPTSQHCLRCGHQWESKLDHSPVQCPSCHSVLWNKKRRDSLGNSRKCECVRCGHQWNSNLDRDPKQCPSCHSPYWNRLRIRPSQLTYSRNRS